MEFNSLEDLKKYVEGTNGSGLTFSDGKDTADILKEEAKKLYDYVQEEIDNYYKSYTPTVYKRTHEFQRSLRMSEVKQEGIEAFVEIFFDNAKATHPSIFDGKDGYVPILLNYGWQWKNDPRIYHLSYYEGFDFIGKAIERYNAENKYGFKIEVSAEYDGVVVENKEY